MAAETMRTIIIDDEKDAIDFLQELLKDHPETEVIATADNNINFVLRIYRKTRTARSVSTGSPTTSNCPKRI